MNETTFALLMLVIGYAIGGIPFGYIMARLRGIDIRQIGSGNIGATNVGRALGKKLGGVALFLDIFKGLLPTALLVPVLANLFDASIDSVWGQVAMAGGCVLGHVFTPFLKFKGGKGVATAVGVFVALIHYWILLPLAGYILVRKLTGYVSAGSILLSVLMPVASAIAFYGTIERDWPVVLLGALTGALLLFRHRTNIARLREGKELVSGISDENKCDDNKDNKCENADENSEESK